MKGFSRGGNAMETRRKRFYLAAAVLVAALAGGAYLAYRSPSERRVTAGTADWGSRPRAMVRLMMERYGPPDALAPDAVTWRDRAPWKRIVVRARPRAGFLEQTVGYSVPISRLAPLLEFGHGVRVGLDVDELSVAGDDESLNRLALNLAHEVVAGRRGPEDARDFYDKTVKLSRAGKGSAYLTNLLFKPYAPAPGDKRKRGFGYY